MNKTYLARPALAVMLLAACLAPLCALDPKLELDEYAVERYTTENGLPQSSVMALVQTRDGYLWLGTYEGLARFDGQAFTVFDKSNTPEMESNSIKALAEDAQGRLWVGTTVGLAALQWRPFRALRRAPRAAQPFHPLPAHRPSRHSVGRNHQWPAPPRAGSIPAVHHRRWTGFRLRELLGRRQHRRFMDRDRTGAGSLATGQDPGLQHHQRPAA